MPLGESTGIDEPGEVWKKFHNEKHLIPRLENSSEIGVAYIGNAPKGCFTYFAGSEVNDKAKDSRFVNWLLPTGEYVVCGFEAEDFEQLVTSVLNKAIKYCDMWLKEHGLTIGECLPEMYYNNPNVAYMELWMAVSD